MFGTIDVKARPLRLAHLVDPNKPEQVRAAIRLSSSLWGGTYFPIIPLYKRIPRTWRDGPLKAPTAKEVILGYLDAFDPDVLVQFSAAIPDYVADAKLQIINPDLVWSVLEEGKSLSPRFGVGLFEILDDIFVRHFRYVARHPARVILPEIPRQLSLFWASWFGELPQKLLPLLEESYFDPLEIQAEKFDLEKLPAILDDHGALFPARLVRHDLVPQPRFHRQLDEAHVYLLDADKVEDVVDFWNLKALGRSVMPVPRQLWDNPQFRDLAVKFIKRISHDRASIMRSPSCTSEELQDYADSLSAHGRDSSGRVLIQDRYPRIWSEWARDKGGEAPHDVFGVNEYSLDVAELKEVKLRGLLPEFAQKYGFHGEARCANEVSFRFYGADEYLAEVFPKSSGRNFLRAISGFSPSRDWRIGRNGLVRIVEEPFSEYIGAPTAEGVFFAWLSDLGWKPRLSPPGLLAKQIYKRLNGNPAALKNEKLLGLLEEMSGGRVRGGGGSGEEVGRFVEERYLQVGAVKNRLRSASGDDNLHGYLASKGVFKLGIQVRCPQCQRNSWYPLDGLRDTLLCPKCLTNFSAIGNVSARDWSYRTVGPFSVPGFADGSYAVLLALSFFSSRGTSTALRTTPVMSFNATAPGRENIEADFAMFWQESSIAEHADGILFGECKTYGKFQEVDFRRMRYLAESFPGSVLVFCTLRKSLTSQEVSGIRSIAKEGRRYWKSDRPINPVMVLTGTELLSQSPPPYCWEESKRTRIRLGFLGLCEATQQMYLDLPSWHEEWREKWEKSRRRRAKGGAQ